MKYIVGFAAIALLSACSSGSEPNAEQSGEVVEDSGSVADAASEEYTLPYDLPMAPNTRLVMGSSYTSGGLGESVASLATTDDGKAVLDFYEGELTKAGWEVYSRGSNSAKPSFAAKKDDLRIQASLFRSGEPLNEGETDVRLTAKYPE